MQAISTAWFCCIPFNENSPLPVCTVCWPPTPTGVTCILNSIPPFSSDSQSVLMEGRHLEKGDGWADLSPHHTCWGTLSWVKVTEYSSSFESVLCISNCHICHSIYFWTSWSRFTSQEIIVSHLMIHPVFYGTQITLPFSQKPAINPCPEADKSSPHIYNLFFNLHLNTVLKSMPQTLQVVSFLQVFL